MADDLMRELALTTLRLYVEAIASDQTELAGPILATAVPESPDVSQATFAGTIGVALDLLDAILTGNHADAPPGISVKARLPQGRWYGERAARDILDLARRGRAHNALGALITKQAATRFSQAQRLHWRARCRRGRTSSANQSIR